MSSADVWSQQDAELIDWYRINRRRFVRPCRPFFLYPWAEVIGPQFFLRLDQDINQGPHGPRARNRVLQEDLARLRELFDRPADAARSPGGRPTAAATLGKAA